MATPFDATTKELVRIEPRHWLQLLGRPDAPCELIDADLATVSTEADRLIRVQTPMPHLVHIEFQAGHDGHAVPDRVLRYNILASVQTGLSVLSHVVLLRPEADSPALTGTVQKRRPDGSVYHQFAYDVLRLWQVPAADVLQGGLATLPVALLTDLSATSPEAVVTALEGRIGGEAPLEQARTLWASTYLLCGLRFSPAMADILLAKAVAQMKESATYQAILAQGLAEGREVGRAEGTLDGRLQEVRTLVLRLGTRRLGIPEAGVGDRLEAITELAVLEGLADRLLEVESWQELLAP